MHLLRERVSDLHVHWRFSILRGRYESNDPDSLLKIKILFFDVEEPIPKLAMRMLSSSCC